MGKYLNFQKLGHFVALLLQMRGEILGPGGFLGGLDAAAGGDRRGRSQPVIFFEGETQPCGDAVRRLRVHHRSGVRVKLCDAVDDKLLRQWVGPRAAKLFNLLPSPLPGAHHDIHRVNLVFLTDSVHERRCVELLLLVRITMTPARHCKQKNRIRHIQTIKPLKEHNFLASVERKTQFG